MNIKTFWHRARTLYLLLKISSQPKNTTAGLAIAESLLALGLLEEESKTVCTDEASAKIVALRTLPKVDSLDELSKLPRGTLGHEYARHMKAENLSPNFFKKLKIESDQTFVMMHLRATHDLWHIVTGFGTSVPDELGLQAFMMAQVRSPLAPLLIGGRLAISAFSRSGESREILMQVCRGWMMGIRARPIFALDWATHFATPLEEIRTMYGVH